MTLNNLLKSNWIFTLLFIFADKQCLPLFSAGTSIHEITKKLGLNNFVVSQMFNFLSKENIIEKIGDKYYFTLIVKTMIEEAGLNSFVNKLTLHQGKSAALLDDIQHNKWQHGWHYQNEALLQSQGDKSEVVVDILFADFAALQTALKKDPIKIMDIGAGTGKISLKYCADYPNVHVTAIEPADLPHKLAHQNIAHSKFANRIELRKCYAQEINDVEKFDVIWFPQAFLTNDDDFHMALEKIFTALKPGGLLLSATMDEENALYPLDQFIYAISTAARSITTLTDAFKHAGFEQVIVKPAKLTRVPILAIKPL